MGTELTTEQAFQEKIKDRLAEDIGGLMPDELLAEMVKRSIDDMFFGKDKWFGKEVQTLLEAQIKDSIQHYFAENQEKIIADIKESLKERVPELAATYIQGVLSGAGQDIGIALNNLIIGAMNRHY